MPSVYPRRLEMRAHALFLLSGLTLVTSLSACGIATDGDDTDAQESDVKKKVKPSAGNGAFDLTAPTWSATSAQGAFAFAGSAVPVGGRVERVSGSYFWTLQYGATIRDKDGNSQGYQMSQAIKFDVVQAGIISKKPSGLRVRFDEPVTMGGSRVLLGQSVYVDGFGQTSPGQLNHDGKWRSESSGVLLFALPGTVALSSSSTGALPSVTLNEGQLKEVVLPIAKVKVDLDSYDPAYPDDGCGVPFVRVASSNVYSQDQYLRKADGSSVGTIVVPQGSGSQLQVYGAALSKNLTPSAGETVKVSLNRLEVDDVEFKKTGGGSELVPGTFTIEYKTATGTYASTGCSFHTHRGVDLPDGDYRITSQASTASGMIKQVEEVSFP